MTKTRDLADLGGGFIQAGTGAVQRTVESKLQDVVSVKDFGAVGDGVADDTVAIQAAIDASDVIQIPSGLYNITSSILLGNGKRLSGTGTLKATASITGGAVVKIFSNNIHIEDITIDCSLVPVSNVCRGIGVQNPGLSNITIDGVTVKSASFTGIDIFRPSGSLSHNNITITNCTVLDSGWEGISVTAGNNTIVSNCKVISSGYNGINFWQADTDYVIIDSNYVNRAVPPTRVYNSQPESGGLLYLGPGSGSVVVSNNVLIDNRNANEDGIILGEDGSVDFESVIITGNVVKQAGQFGIDAHSNFTVTGNSILEARNSGIFIGADLGGTVRNITVSGNTVANTGNASHVGIGINITSNLGNINYFNDIIITGNLVVDYRPTPYTTYGVGINLADAFFDNVFIQQNNFKDCPTPIGYFNSGFAGEIYAGNNQINVPISLTGATSTYDIKGGNIFTLDPGALHTVTDFTNGYQGQEIHVVFLRGDTTLDLSGNLMKAGNLANYTPDAFSRHTAVKVGSTWYWDF